MMSSCGMDFRLLIGVMSLECNVVNDAVLIVSISPHFLRSFLMSELKTPLAIASSRFFDMCIAKSVSGINWSSHSFCTFIRSFFLDIVMLTHLGICADRMILECLDVCRMMDFLECLLNFFFDSILLLESSVKSPVQSPVRSPVLASEEVSPDVIALCFDCLDDCLELS